MGAHSRHKELVAGLHERRLGRVCWIGPDPAIAGIDIVDTRVEAGSWFGRNLERRRIAAILARRLSSSASGDRTVVTFSETGLLVALIAARTAIATRYFHFQRADHLASNHFLLRDESRRRERARLRARLGLLRHLYRRAARAGFRFIVQSAAQQRGLREVVRDPARIEVLPNNCNPSWVQAAPRTQTTVPGSARLLLIANLYARGKGIDLALAAMSRLPRCSLTIVGDGPDFALLARAAANLPNVTLAGAVRNAASMMSDFDVLVVPTRIDHYPNVLLEGLAHEIPIVATDIEAHRTILGEDFPFSPLEADALAARIEELVRTPSAVQRLLEVQKPRQALHTFDWVGRAAELLELA